MSLIHYKYKIVYAINKCVYGDMMMINYVQAAKQQL